MAASGGGHGGDGGGGSEQSKGAIMAKQVGGLGAKTDGVARRRWLGVKGEALVG